MNKRMKASLVTDALIMAMFRRGMPKGTIIHSDRGSQYCSHAYHDLASKHNFKVSMSRKGNCWDNAVAESFFKTIKVEFVYKNQFSTQDQAKLSLFNWTETWYNRRRRHSALGYMTPDEFEKKFNNP